MTCNAFQILISEHNVLESSQLSPILKNASDIFKNHLPIDHTYELYNKDSIAEFIKQNLGKEVLKAYNKLKPYAFKGDLGKYCIGYIKGGWYSDITLKIVSNLPKMHKDCEIVCFRDQGAGLNPYALSYGIQSSLFYAKRKNQIFYKAIELILENCRKENYGISTVCPTGPGVFGRAFAFYGAQKNQVVGSYFPLTPLHENKNRAYVLPDGRTLALHKDAWMEGSKPGDISNFGAIGTNNYVTMYYTNDIYT